MKKTTINGIPPTQYNAYKKHVAALRLTGASSEMIERAFSVGHGYINLNLIVYLDIIGFPEVVHIPGFVNEVK